MIRVIHLFSVQRSEWTLAGSLNPDNNCLHFHSTKTGSSDLYSKYISWHNFLTLFIWNVVYLNTSTTSGNATFPPSGYVRPVWWKHIKSLYFFVKCCEWMLSTGLRVIQRICVFTVGFWSDAVGADDSGADPLRRHWPFRDVGLPKRRVQNSTTNQLSRWAVSCPPPPPHILCIFTCLFDFGKSWS